jgi:U3 small nucleolar RNA-associated protein 14
LRKPEAAPTPATEQAQNGHGHEPAADDDSHDGAMRPITTLTQQELIARAFAGDDVQVQSIAGRPTFSDANNPLLRS